MTNITPAALKAAVEGNVENFLAASTPGGIEAQEAAGQRAMVSNFNTLPKELESGRKWGDYEDGRRVAEAFGFVFGEDADELFVNVTPPTGWTLKATGHSMHSDVLDETGAKRGGIFYKAAFYDRRANGTWYTRYHPDRTYEEAPSLSYTMLVRDRRGAEPLWSEHVTYDESEAWEVRRDREKGAAARAEQFLDQRFPDWRNPLAYWNA